jgi:hypothetical protein
VARFLEAARQSVLRARSLVEKPLQQRRLLSTDGLRLPDFLGIGAQKAGTTWLFEQLRTHPEIYFPRRKELHYFDENFHRPLHWYASHFVDADARRAGEITPAYAILDERRLAYLAAVMPRVRAILLLRDPVERAWSQAVMTLVEQPMRDPAAIDTAEFAGFVRSPTVLRRSRYSATIDAWRRHFPESQMLVAFHDELRATPQQLLDRITGFLGVQPTAPGPARDRVVYRGLGLPMPDPIRAILVAELAPELDALARRFGGPAEAWRRRWRQ